MVDARVGDSRPHSHLAHQACLAVESEVEIVGDSSLLVPRNHAALIPAGVVHRLGPAGAQTRSFFIDAALSGPKRDWRTLSLLLPVASARALGAIADFEAANEFASKMAGRALSPSIDARIAKALLLATPGSSATELARRAGISPSRLREIAIRDYGVPPSKLLQWRQLMHAVAAVGEGCGLADAAAAGGFADQSHFTRRCVQWLGVTPRSGLGSLFVG